MSVLFVSDVHLCTQKPATTAGFLHFLRTHAISVQALYILGDLFEIWVGDDDPNPLHQELAIELQKLYKLNIPCYFIHGNRDFLLSQRYANTCGITLLPEQQVIQLNGLRVVLLHGDTLCTDDSSYQHFRHWVRKCWLQRLFLSLPVSLRIRIADRIRAKSSSTNVKKASDIVDVNTKRVITVLKRTGASLMVHGHTHQLAIHKLPGKRHRAVLGSWQAYGSAIEITDKDIILHKFYF